MKTLKQKSLNLLILLFVSSFLSVTAQTVYVTKTGKKYHTESCRYLKYSKIKMDLKQAKSSGYGACKVCKPPVQVVTQSKSAKTTTKTKVTTKKVIPKKTTISRQCSATTQKGTRCKRKTTSSCGKCWQHQ